MQPANLARPDPRLLVALIQQGRLAEAWPLAGRLLRERPNDPALLQLAAIVAMQRGDPGNGVKLLRRAAELAPNDPGIAFNLAKALGDSGAPADALAAVDRPPLARDPQARRLRADLLKRLGRWKEARQAYAALVAEAPRDAELRNNLATLCLAENDPDEAIAHLEVARTLAPAQATLHVNLAKAHGLAGRGVQSLAAAEAAHGLAPGDRAVELERARALNRLLRPQQALAVLADVLTRNPDDAEILTELGLTFSWLAEFERSEEAYRKALDADPTFAQAYLNLGVLLEQGNRLDELGDVLARAEAAAVVGPEIDFLRAMDLRRRGEFAAALALLERPDEEGAVEPGIRAQILGQCADRLGDAATAFAAFCEMNAAARAHPVGRQFEGSEYRTYIAEFTAALTPQWATGWPQASPGERASPVFLVGFPRSGTTLLDTVLMGHPAMHVLEEEPVLAGVHEAVGDLRRIPQLGADEVGALREQYFAGVEALGAVPAGATIVDKLPLNLLRAPLIHRLFPDARFILALRHPCDAVLSCFMQNFKVNRAMASFWSIEDTAKTYDAAFSFWERARELFPLRVHAIRYEDMVADMPGEIGSLLDFLGLERHEGMLDFQQTASERAMIRTPSYAQVTEGLYRRAQGRWIRYHAQLAPVLPILAPWAEKFGYTLEA